MLHLLYNNPLKAVRSSGRKENCLQHVIHFTLASLLGLLSGVNLVLYQVASILGSHPDLKEQCEDFIIYVEKTGQKHLMLYMLFIATIYVC